MEIPLQNVLFYISFGVLQYFIAKYANSANMEHTAYSMFSNHIWIFIQCGTTMKHDNRQPKLYHGIWNTYNMLKRLFEQIQHSNHNSSDAIQSYWWLR